MRLSRLWPAGAVTAAVLLLSSDATARTVRVVEYDYDAVWSSAVRLIRVDGRYPVQDKDKATGYILFTFPGSGTVKKCAASLEFVRLEQKDRRRVRLQLQIAHQPSYVEIHLLDKLEKKLRDERGAPRQPGRAPPPPPDKDKKAPRAG